MTFIISTVHIKYIHHTIQVGLQCMREKKITEDVEYSGLKIIYLSDYGLKKGQPNNQKNSQILRKQVSTGSLVLISSHPILCAG